MRMLQVQFEALTGIPISGIVITNLFFIRFAMPSSAKNQPLVS
jgi:hypothetical protein